MQKSVKSTEFLPEACYKNGLSCIMVIQNYGLAMAEGVISI